MNNILNIFVITLKNKKDYLQSENYQSLKKITNKIILSKGVLLTPDEKNNIIMYSPSVLGCACAHIKLWKKIINKYSNTDTLLQNYSLILEDDAFLDSGELLDNSNIIIDICKKEFDIYKLHSDVDNESISTAAYIINHKSIHNIIKYHTYILGHLDADLYILHLLGLINIRVSPVNIFKTNEVISLNRSNKQHIILDLLCDFNISKRSNKTFKNLLKYNTIKIFNIDLITYDIILIILFIIFYSIFKNNIVLIIFIMLYLF